MKIAGTYLFHAQQQTVWTVLMDPEAIAQALPGVDRLVPIDGEATAWRATAKIGIATVSGSYTGIVRMNDIAAPDRYRLSVKGEGQGSVIGGSAELVLSCDPAKNTTLVSWTADADIYGRLAGVAQRLLAAAASMLATQFFRSLARQLPGVAESVPPEEGPA